MKHLIAARDLGRAYRRERDQARDALTDLLLALDDPGPHRAVQRTPALVSAIQQARTVLRGGEGRDGNAGD